MIKKYIFIYLFCQGGRECYSFIKAAPAYLPVMLSCQSVIIRVNVIMAIILGRRSDLRPS